MFCAIWRATHTCAATSNHRLIGMEPGGGRLLRGLVTAELVERVGRGQVGNYAVEGKGCATAARPILRKTAENALREFPERVERVNREARFLGGVNRVVLFGSMLREEVSRLRDHQHDDSDTRRPRRPQPENTGVDNRNKVTGNYLPSGGGTRYSSRRIAIGPVFARRERRSKK
jgi:hypothetical protein